MNAGVVGGRRVVAKRAGLWRDLFYLGGRGVRSVTRDFEMLVTALIVPAFFFVINVGALQDLTELGATGLATGFDYKAFQIPVAVLFAVTGLSRANILVSDIQGGYFDRLALTPVNRLAMLLGLLVADMAIAVVMTIPVLILALAVGVSFSSGPLGVIVLLLLTVIWTAIYNGFPYAVALKTGNPAMVNASFIIFFPVVFMSPVFVPQEAMTGWMATIVQFNPVTYLLRGMRSLINEGWVFEDILGALAGIAAIGLISIPLASWALRGRVRRR